MSLEHGLVNLLQQATCLSNTQWHHMLSQNALSLLLQVTERCYIVCFSCFDKVSGRSNLWKEGCILLTFWDHSPSLREAGLQSSSCLSTASTVGEQRKENAATWLMLSLHSVQESRQWDGASLIWVGIPSLDELPRDTLLDTQILNPLTVTESHTLSSWDSALLSLKNRILYDSQ